MNLQELNNKMPNLKIYAAVAAAVLIAVATATGCWYIWKPAPKVPEIAAKEEKQKDGSVVLEKAPDPKAKPAMMTPKGEKVERTATVTVRPDKGPDPVTNKCPDIKVDLAITQDPKTLLRRITAKSPDGEIVAGLDIPVEDAVPPPKEKSWAAGATISTNNKYGGWVDRDMGPWRLGIQINQASDTRGGVEGWAKAGIRF